MADLFTAHDNYVKAHALLQTMADDTIAEAKEQSRQIIENYLANREIWAELEHYRC